MKKNPPDNPLTTPKQSESWNENRLTIKDLDDSHWFRFRGDRRNTGCNTRVTGPSVFNLKWSYKTANEVMSSPVLDFDGSILAGCHDGKIYHIDKTGELINTYKTGESVISTPLSGINFFFAGSLDGNMYRFAFKGDSKYYNVGDWIVSSANFNDLGNIIFAGRDGYLYCITQDLDQMFWKTEIGAQSYEIQSSPAYYNGKIYIGSGAGGVFCLDDSGKILWEFRAGGPVFASPAVDEKGRVYVGSHDGNFYCLNTDGSLLWKYTTKGTITSSAALAPDGNLVFASMDGVVYSLAASDGKLNWKVDTGAPVECSPASDREGTIFIGNDRGDFLCIDDDGSVLWTYRAGGPILSSPAITDEGEAVFGCEDRNIYSIWTKNETR